MRRLLPRIREIISLQRMEHAAFSLLVPLIALLTFYGVRLARAVITSAERDRLPEELRKSERGSTFSFTVPAVRKSAPSTGKTILVCDDDSSVRVVIAAILETHGYH